MQLLLDRLCLSLTLAKPVGLATWAQREVQRFGADGVGDIADAAADALLTASETWEVDRARVEAFVDILIQEIGRVTSAAQTSDAPASDPSEATNALLATLAERDLGTCAHSKATEQWARRLSNELGLPKEMQDFIGLCAVLHDIGKIATPDAILNKPGALTEGEWVIMREHSAAGERILERVPSLKACAVIVRAHHERVDGTGYPDKLSGANIPLEARVVAVADAFHAMISERPYRQPISPREALWLLEKGAGSQWDRDVVDAMLSMLKRGKQIPRNTSQVSSA